MTSKGIMSFLGSVRSDFTNMWRLSTSFWLLELARGQWCVFWLVRTYSPFQSNLLSFGESIKVCGSLLRFLDGSHRTSSGFKRICRHLIIRAVCEEEKIHHWEFRKWALISVFSSPLLVPIQCYNDTKSFRICYLLRCRTSSTKLACKRSQCSISPEKELAGCRWFPCSLTYTLPMPIVWNATVANKIIIALSYLKYFGWIIKKKSYDQTIAGNFSKMFCKSVCTFKISKTLTVLYKPILLPFNPQCLHLCKNRMFSHPYQSL